MSHRVSIYELWDELQKDPNYSDRDSVQEIVEDIIVNAPSPPLTFNINPDLVGIGLATDPVFRLILVLCGLSGLSTYESGKSRPTGWSGQKFADRCHLKLEIDLDELERVLFKQELPLPRVWFPDAEKPSTPDQLIAKELISETENALCRGEGVWYLKYGGQHAHINNLDGLAYIANLINRSGERILSSDLVALVKGREFEYPPTNEEMSLSTLGLDLSVEDTKKLENIGHEIWEELERAKDRNDQDRIERANQKLDQYRKYLLNEYGVKVLYSDKYHLYFKKLHRQSPEQEKARQTVKNRVEYAYKKIGNDIPALEKYLRLHIKYEKGFWRYEPDPENPLEWYIYL